MYSPHTSAATIDLPGQSRGRASQHTSRQLDLHPPRGISALMGMADYSYQSLATMGPQGRWRRVLLMVMVMVPMVFVFAYYSSPTTYMPGRLQSTQYAARDALPLRSS